MRRNFSKTRCWNESPKSFAFRTKFHHLEESKDSPGPRRTYVLQGNDRWSNSMSLVNRRKGVSLSLETIVVLVLAVLVLAVLLYFFSSNFYPAQTKIDDLNKQRELCAEYVNNYPRCDSTAFPKMSDLSKVCLKLGYQSCNNPNSIFCVQECCAILCGTTATCEQRQGTCTPDTGCTSPRQNYGQLNCGINQVCCV